MRFLHTQMAWEVDLVETRPTLGFSVVTETAPTANRVGLSDRLIPIFAAPVFYLRLIDAPGTLIQRVLREGSKGEGYESLVTQGALQ